MKKLFFILMLLCSAMVYAQKTNNPSVSSSNYSDTKIKSVEITDSHTIVELGGIATSDYYQAGLDAATKLIITDKFGVKYRYNVLWLEDGKGKTLALGQMHPMPRGKWSVRLHFPLIPKGYTSISVVEQDNADMSTASGWRFSGIKIKNPAESDAFTLAWLSKASSKNIAMEYAKAYTVGDMEKIVLMDSKFYDASSKEKQRVVKSYLHGYEDIADRLWKGINSLNYKNWKLDYKLVSQKKNTGNFDEQIIINVLYNDGSIAFIYKLDMKETRDGWKVADFNAQRGY